MNIYSIVGVYMLIFMVMTSISIALTVLVLSLHHKKSPTPPPDWLISLTHTYLQPGKKMTEVKSCADKNSNLNNGNSKEKHKNSAALASLEEHNIKEEANEMVLVGKKKYYELQMEILSGLSKQLQRINDRYDQKEADDAARVQWKNAAAILDRSFFWLFLFLMIILTIIVLVVLPLAKSEPDLNPPKI